MWGTLNIPFVSHWLDSPPPAGLSWKAAAALNRRGGGRLASRHLRWPQFAVISQQLLYRSFLFLFNLVPPVKEVQSLGNSAASSQQSLSHYNETHLIFPSVSLRHGAVSNTSIILSESAGISFCWQGNKERVGQQHTHTIQPPPSFFQVGKIKTTF